MDSGQVKAQADTATYVPMAMSLALRPRHKLIPSQCTSQDPGSASAFSKVAAQAQTDSEPVYLVGPWHSYARIARQTKTT